MIMAANLRRTALVVVLGGLISSAVLADPCGMVPPITIQDSTPITRIGDQETYVFFKDGLETFVIRPGFSGKTEEFGMLIPFPTPPAIRKVPDGIFTHIAKAVDPPEIVIDLRLKYLRRFSNFRGRGNQNDAKRPSLAVEKSKSVRVIREEAVGMYEIAVLDAGSAEALKRWMDDHKYKFPQGMDKVCEDYVKDGWCFVAVKTRVGTKQGVDPQPGVQEVKTGLPSGATFDGHVQGMGFRFKTDQLVVPMRLSAFNEGELHNIVYLMTDSPKKIRSIPEEYVVRQISGKELFRNLTGPLPLRIIGGTEKDIPQVQLKSLAQRRDPRIHNGDARDLFAADMLTVKTGRLSHPHEEAEKMLLRIGEHFGLRGPSIDKQNSAALADDREKATKQALADVKKMTLTVIDGDFPREVLAGKNLAFAEYQMPKRRNTPAIYDAKTKKPGGVKQGVLKLGQLNLSPRTTPDSRISAIRFSVFFAAALLFGLTVFGYRKLQ